jgi:hypothetical protein
MSERRTAFRLSYSVASSFFKNFFVDFFAFPIVNTGQRSHRHSARPPAGARKSGRVLSVGSCAQHTHRATRPKSHKKAVRVWRVRRSVSAMRYKPPQSC